MAKYGIAVDTRRCIGCWSCSVACKLENNLPDQVWYNKVETVGGDQPNTPAGEYGNNTLSYIVMHCQHCDEAPCVASCPTGATYKEEDTGITMVNTDDCIGCQTCIEVCPYEGVRTYLEDEPISVLDWPVGSQLAPKHKANTVEKCTLCHHRVVDGQEPACVEGCPARARVFGDLDDPNSEISQLIASRDAQRELEEEGTEPKIYYLY